ncbi:MAG TPA: SpoIVB peptidase S55 domain-containing protein [Blastocatellia bacterium]|nr:SpoIVB peptidase S55 domain-containing protein [Blastocatellia bacterium]
MRRLVTFALLAMILSTAEFTTRGQASLAAHPEVEQSIRKDQFFPVADVKPGMRATGYTVFVGSEPKPFELEILGVLKGFPNPQQSAVLSKLLGDDLKHTGVFQGMSGSPVYIDGKLLGAVAFGYMFAKDPIAGITPIEHMIDVFEQKQNKDQSDKPEIGKPRTVSFSEIAFNEKSNEFLNFVKGVNGTNPTAAAQAVAAPSGLQVLQPIATPLAISGVSPEVVARFAPLFQSWGLAPVAGVSGAAEITQLKKANKDTLKPGSTIVVPLVRGDYSLAAAGTVTYRDGNQIYAFGHPFLQLGVSEFPMHEGEVVTVMSSAATSFKVSYPTAMVGTMRGDRSTGIYGELGIAPRMIPVEINMQTSRGGSQSYHFEVVADRFLTPILMQLTVLSTITTTERTLGDSTLQLRGKIKLKDQAEINLENRLSVSLNAPLAAAFAVSQPISVLFNSGFKDLQFEKLSFDIISRDARNTGQLDRLWINRTEVRRGEQIEAQAFARTEGGEEYVERIPIEIPEDAPIGPLQIIVSDGNALQASEPRTGFTPQSLDQLVREMNRLRRADRLYVRLARAQSGALIKNEELPSLPPSVLATLGSDRTSGGYILTRSATVLEKELPPAKFVISGQRMLTINVVNP